MLDPTEAAKRLSDDLTMGYVSRPNGGGMTWNENREAADSLIAIVLAEALAIEDAEIARLRAELEAWRHPDVAPSTPLAAELIRLRAIEEAARAFVAVWGETEAMESSHVFAALRAALGSER